MFTVRGITFDNEEEAKAFANFIRGLEPMQITRRVKQLVHDRKICADWLFAD